MYIEFQLPPGNGGITASHALGVILNQFRKWAEKHSIEYRQKIIKHTLRITFDSDESYTLFALTWVADPKHPSWTTYRLITDLNNKI